jgi:hypothetical protein
MREERSNTMQLVDLIETLGGEDCVGTAMVALIKTAIEAISQLCHTHYPMNLSPEDELAIKNQDICWACNKEIFEGMHLNYLKSY